MLTQNYNSAKELPHSRTPDEFRQLVSSNEFHDMKQQQFGQSVKLDRGITFGSGFPQPGYNTAQKTQLDLINDQLNGTLEQTESGMNNYNQPPTGMPITSFRDHCKQRSQSSYTQNQRCSNENLNNSIRQNSITAHLDLALLRQLNLDEKSTYSELT